MRLWVMMSVALLGGYAQGVWMRPGATQLDFAQDQAECQLTAELGSPDHHTNTAHMKAGAALAVGLLDGIGNALRQKRVVELCMTAHGWSFLQQPAMPAITPVQTLQPPVLQSSAQTVAPHSMLRGAPNVTAMPAAVVQAGFKTPLPITDPLARESEVPRSISVLPRADSFSAHVPLIFTPPDP